MCWLVAVVSHSSRCLRSPVGWILSDKPGCWWIILCQIGSNTFLRPLAMFLLGILLAITVCTRGLYDVCCQYWGSPGRTFTTSSLRFPEWWLLFPRSMYVMCRIAAFIISITYQFPPEPGNRQYIPVSGTLRPSWVRRSFALARCEILLSHRNRQWRCQMPFYFVSLYSISDQKTIMLLNHQPKLY